MELDWSDGTYELTAQQLEPAAARLVEAATLRPGERVLDLGCGTGNAALLAAKTGAKVKGIDPAKRLLEVARARAREAGLDVEFAPGTGEATGEPDGRADAVLAVFSIVFAPDADQIAKEIVRILAPGGRALISSWVPEGGLAAVMARLGRDLDRPPSRWAQPESIRGIFEPLGVEAEITEHELSFEAASAEAMFASFETEHPAWRAIRKALPEGWDALRRDSIAILEAHNESRSALRVPSKYRIIRVERPGDS